MAYILGQSESITQKTLADRYAISLTVVNKNDSPIERIDKAPCNLIRYTPYADWIDSQENIFWSNKPFSLLVKLIY